MSYVGKQTLHEPFQLHQEKDHVAQRILERVENIEKRIAERVL